MSFLTRLFPRGDLETRQLVVGILDTRSIAEDSSKEVIAKESVR